MKNTTILVLVVVVLSIAGYSLFNLSQSEKAPTIVSASQGNGVQEVTIGMKNYNYDPQLVKVKAGQPVRIYLDDSVYGCFRDFTVRELGIRKYLKTPEDYIEFTPEKGSYTFACSMGMGVGRLMAE